MPKIELKDVSLRYGPHRTDIAVHELSLAIEDGEFACVLGPSGCGKSTTLNLLAGFLRPSSGQVLVGGRPVDGAGPERGVVFQRHTLFPWKTVGANVELGLRVRGVPAQERRKISQQFLKEMGLEDFRDRYPFHLSVGMRQRVGLARAFANDPDVLLMDEPFASLDAQTRLRMQELLLTIWSRHQKTVVFVTHDIDEAILLADRILLLSPRPASLAKELRVSIPRPRDRSVMIEAEGVRLKKQILHLLGN